MLLFIAIITRWEKASKSQAAFCPFEAHRHRLSLRCLSSCHFAGGPAGIPPILPSSSPRFRSLCRSVSLICYFHPLLFFAFVSLPCHVISPFPLYASCIFILPPPLLLPLFQYHRGDNRLLTLLRFLFTDMSISWAYSQGFKGKALLFKLLMISETVFLWFNHSLVHFYHSGKTSWV